MCVHITVHICRTQHSTEQFRIIFPLILQSNPRAQILSIGEEGHHHDDDAELTDS